MAANPYPFHFEARAAAPVANEGRRIEAYTDAMNVRTKLSIFRRLVRDHGRTLRNSISNGGADPRADVRGMFR